MVHPSVPAQDRRGAGRAREGQSGQAQLRRRGRVAAPHRVGPVPAGDRHRGPVRPLPRHGAGDERPDRGSDPAHDRRDRTAAAAHPGRQGARARSDRHDAQPRVPAAADHDRGRLSRYVQSFWTGVVAPAGTPAEIVAKAQRRDQRRPEVGRHEGAPAPSLNVEPNVTTPQEFATFVAAEAKKWGDIITLDRHQGGAGAQTRHPEERPRIRAPGAPRVSRGAVVPAFEARAPRGHLRMTRVVERRQPPPATRAAPRTSAATDRDRHRRIGAHAVASNSQPDTAMNAAITSAEHQREIALRGGGEAAGAARAGTSSSRDAWRRTRARAGPAGTAAVDRRVQRHHAPAQHRAARAQADERVGPSQGGSRAETANRMISTTTIRAHRTPIDAAVEPGLRPRERREAVIDRVARLDQARRRGDHDESRRKQEARYPAARGARGGAVTPSGRSPSAASTKRHDVAAISQMRSIGRIRSAIRPAHQVADDERGRAPQARAAVGLRRAPRAP